MATAMPPQPKGRFRLPDPPEREPDEVTNYDHIHRVGSALHLRPPLWQPRYHPRRSRPLDNLPSRSLPAAGPPP